MSDFHELASHITHLSTTQSPVIVAISGFGGAGKTTLANQLRDHFHLHDNQIIRIDHLYGPNPTGPHIFDQSDWPLIRSLLQNIRAGKRLKYRGKNYEGEPLHFDEELPPIAIIEGVRLLQPDLAPFFDVSVWIDCPQPIALSRAKARDRAQGEDEATVALWDTDWGPKDTHYFTTFRPDLLATHLYN